MGITEERDDRGGYRLDSRAVGAKASSPTGRQTQSKARPGKAPRESGGGSVHGYGRVRRAAHSEAGDDAHATHREERRARVYVARTKIRSRGAPNSIFPRKRRLVRRVRGRGIENGKKTAKRGDFYVSRRNRLHSTFGSDGG